MGRGMGGSARYAGRETWGERDADAGRREERAARGETVTGAGTGAGTGGGTRHGEWEWVG